MHNLKDITYKLLNTPPYQLPPVVHTGGTYSLDLQYRGKAFFHVGSNLIECMTRYHDFVVRVNDQHRFRQGDFDKLPVSPGRSIQAPYPTDHPVTTINESLNQKPEHQ